ncbi:MAG TPA: hypothetical protein VKX45_00505 [Bryobacteraceae bacterium]|jgi:hypothetical protein|nr:hypothetical protein [Bryobacteraceae bacterium]
MTTWIGASCQVYRVILYAYPSRLRAEFGEDMLSLFEQQLVDARRSGGSLEVCRIWGRTLWETAHLIAMPFPAAAECRIAAISLLGSSALFAFFFWAAGLARHCVK